MKFLLFASMAAVAAANVDVDDGSLALEDRFEAYIEKFSKTYTDDEKVKRFTAFQINDAIIQESNSQDLPYKLGHNVLSDLTNDEFKATYINGYKESLRPKKFDYTLSDKARVSAAPASIDWVAKGAVTPVKNQGQCGSCWAFSTIMGVEGDLFVETGTLTSLSEQDLVSCDHNGDQGCNGGLMDNAFEFIVTNGGIATEASYPYVSGSGSVPACKSSAEKAVTIKDHTDVPAKDENALKVAAAQQPVSVAIEADKSVFQLYKSGVLTGDCGTTLDHGVGVVGYGTESGTDYWKVKNSWGADWGLQGYVLIERGTNKCGISQSASYPTGATSTGSAPSPSVSPSPGSSPSPSPSTPSSTHYGDPKNGCMSDEKSIQITGVAGDACSPACTGVFKTKCPTDVPTGTTAEPKCALQDTSGDKYCILECTSDEHCPENASCKSVSGAPVSLCTYDDR